MTRIACGHDEQYGATMVFVRTSAGEWQPVCDERGMAINIRHEARISREAGDKVLNGFVRAAEAFDQWWERRA